METMLPKKHSRSDLVTEGVVLPEPKESTVTFHIYPGSPQFPVEPTILFSGSVIVSPGATIQILKSALDQDIFSELNAENSSQRVSQEA